MAPELVPVVDGGLGNTTWLVDLGDDRALVVDASRDLRAVHAAANKRRLTIAYAADSHLHADFLTGAVQLAHDEGAQVLASAAGHREFGHRGLADGDEVDLGGLTLRAVGTPGHTDEHLSYLLADGDRPLGVFTGGSLIVGAAARTDLVDPDRTEELARAQYASLRRLATLPDDVAVWPTHGAGSFCSAPPGAARSSTIGAEKATNPLLTAADEDAFVAQLLASLGSYPAYFDRLGEINRRGPDLLDTAGTGRLAPLPVSDVDRLVGDGALIVDVRPVPDYAAAHVPGALSIPLRDQFASWLGWLADPDRPVVLVANPDQDLTDAVWQAVKIGYEQLVGVLEGGMGAWAAAGRLVARTALVGPDQLAGRRVLDIRQDAEFAAGHLPGAEHIELGALAGVAGRLDGGPTVVMCGHGERAAGAASLLECAGHRDLAILIGGPEDWVRGTGRPLVSDS
ncbi:glyoxylase-like metal-dependent hydrolase (beta-lactamase superfamily II) [Blastococcus colisei]|uniref:Glyoxylase-like metal-dependent hydrolase (Beta-lactamase superfamily II) n=1 Tax=Blastococcus colisei TaxID=1564162 RepID=A0A543P0I9_9ACTN|nr:MBL fold metallo-hydrolase [Blastococcus colisei]TQN37609.1 glyoxylase-like metal-dependent hydrolase (beta-lactamase superfamily II) [Blastococcus colisei]